MKPTITSKDVARMAGVAVSTVGRALADDPRISTTTKTRVVKVAAELGYVRSLPARMMRGASSKLLGLVVPNIRNDFFAGIAQALSRCCEGRDYRLALCITEDDRDIEARQVRELTEARAAGIFYVPSASPKARTVADLKTVPHVQLLRRISRLGAPWFGIDDGGCISDAVKHLAALGHTRIAYIGGDAGLSTGANRMNGFLGTCASLGIGADPALIETGSTGFSFGASAAQRLLALTSPPSAIVCGATDVTLGVIEALWECRKRVPEDISLVAFGDPAWSKYCGHGLTAIRFPINELATSCGQWFIDHIESKGAPVTPARTLATSKLMIRGSTSAPPSSGTVPSSRPRRAASAGSRASTATRP